MALRSARDSVRTEREAHVLASLNHPRIAGIYGREESDGVPCPVLEPVEGPTLVERLKAGVLPAKEALELARQIASALESAHPKGIIHRDLKPANIKVTPEGSAKVLDFGPARRGARIPDSTHSGLQIGRKDTRRICQDAA